jgi:trk system potassium uptake protein TrkA
MAKKILIVGGGKVGSYLALLLLREGNQVQVIEGLESEFPRLEKELPGAILIKGGGTDPEVLKAAGIAGADVVAAVTRSDEKNLVVTSLARFEFRVPRTIARVNIPKNAWLFTPEMGVDVMFNQADLMSHLIAEEMTLGEMKTLFKLRRGDYTLVENIVSGGSATAGTAVKDLHLPGESVLCAIIRNGGLIIPRGNTVLREGDEVLTLVHNSLLAEITDLIS